jgi:hypothetical protein
MLRAELRHFAGTSLNTRKLASIAAAAVRRKDVTDLATYRAKASWMRNLLAKPGQSRRCGSGGVPLGNLHPGRTSGCDCAQPYPAR